MPAEPQHRVDGASSIRGFRRLASVEVPAQSAIEGAEKRLLEIAAVFDAPVTAEPYPLALLALGHRSRTLYQAFLELHAGAVPVAGRALLRPMLEINTLVRFLRKDPELHTELWQAEGDRNTVTMVEEIRSSPHLRATWARNPSTAPSSRRGVRRSKRHASAPVGRGCPLEAGCCRQSPGSSR
jgi:hypothetical protein